jgi:hypothetical protein
MRSSRRLSKSRIPKIVVGLALIGATMAVAAPAHAFANTVNVGDATVVEGNTGPNGRTVSVPVSLSQPGTGSSVTVAYTLVGTGSATAGSDYMQKTGTMTFKLNGHGITAVSMQLAIKIIGDTAVEGDETFEVHLSNPQGGGGYSLGRDVGTVTIRDDDPSAGVQMSIGDSATVEGDTGNYARSIKFMVTLSQASTVPVTVQWAVTADTAFCAKVSYGHPTQPNQDCGSFIGTKTLKFAVGGNGFTAVSKMLSVALFTDTAVEGDETFHITLSSITGAGATIADDTGVATIIDDD